MSIQTPALAVLDIMLTDGPCKDLALELTQRDVPFIVYSASSRHKNTLQEFMSAAWIEKPATGKMVVQALAKIQSGHMQREG